MQHCHFFPIASFGFTGMGGTGMSSLSFFFLASSAALEDDSPDVDMLDGREVGDGVCTESVYSAFERRA